MEKKIYGIYEDITQKFSNFVNVENGITPVPIEKMAESLGLSVSTANLNFANSRKYNQRIGELVGTDIVIDENVDYNVGRFAIAHELGHYLWMIKKEEYEELKEKDDSIKVPQYSLPLLPSDTDELFADVYALLLLVPLEGVFKEFRAYLENIEEYPIDITEWWRTISKKADIPFHSVASGYSYIKIAAIEYYKKNIEGKSIQEQYIHYGDLFY